MSVAYRLTLFSSGSTPLTPPAGAPHSEPFRISTIPGVVGFQPFIADIRPDFGAISLPELKLDTGNIAVRILDRRTGVSNAQRWVTAFLLANNLSGLGGYRCLIEESLDNGVTWSTYFVGYTVNMELSSKGEYTLTVRNAVTALKRQVFETVPPLDLPYVAPISLFPIGFARDVWDTGTAPPPSGSPQVASGRTVRPVPMQWVSDNLGNKVRRLQLSSLPADRTQYNVRVSRDKDVAATDELLSRREISRVERIDILRAAYDRLNRPDDVNMQNIAAALHRVWLTINGVTKPALFIDAVVNADNNVTDVYIAEIPPGQTDYATRWDFDVDLPLAAPLANRRCTVCVVANNARLPKALLEQLGQISLPFFLSGVHACDVIRDLADGYFTVSLTGSRQPLFRVNQSNLDAVKAAHPTMFVTLRIDQPMTAVDFLEKHILPTMYHGYRFVPQAVSGTIQPVLELFPLQVTPFNLPTTTIADTDILADREIGWKQDAPLTQVTFKWYVDEINFRGRTGTSLKDAVKEFTNEKPVNQPLPIAFGLQEKKQEYDFKGWRFLRDISTLTVPQREELRGDSARIQTTFTRSIESSFLTRFITGATTTVLHVRRRTALDALRMGDYVLVQSSVIPNVSIQQRGGTRLMQVLSVLPYGRNIRFELVDTGLNSNLPAPTLTFNNPGTDLYSISFAVHASVPAKFRVDYALTAPGVSTVPSEGDPAWTFLTDVRNTTTSPMTVTELLNGARGRRIWLRARTIESANPFDVQLASAWTVATNSFTMNAVPNPSALTVSDITSRSALVSWVNGDNTAQTAIYVSNPSTDPLELVTTVVAGTTRLPLNGLDLNTSNTFRIGVQHVDANGNRSDIINTTFTTTGIAPTLPAIPRFTILRG